MTWISKLYRKKTGSALFKKCILPPLREDARGGAGGARAPPKFQNLLNRQFKIQVER